MNLAHLDRHPVRLTGPLTFDGSHKPCTADKVSSPPRASLWEIHPVYAIEVCTKRTLASCKVDDDSKWVTLEAWLGAEEE
ncbi:MAG: hypothetical protein ABIT01_08170 [Thermoanaerobaculia bacterium]